MAAGVSQKLWEMDDLVAMLEQWELANFKPEYQFVARQYAIGKGHQVSGSRLPHVSLSSLLNVVLSA